MSGDPASGARRGAEPPGRPAGPDGVGADASPRPAAGGGEPLGRVEPAAPPAEVGPAARALDALASLCMAAAGVMLVALVGVFGWLVWGRYVMNDTPTWVEQVSLLLVVWITFLGAAVGVRRGAHLSVLFVRDAMPGPVRAALTVLADLMVLAFGAAMAWQGWALSARNLGREVPMLGVSEAWRTAPLVACGALVALFAAARLAGLATARRPRPGALRARG